MKIWTTKNDIDGSVQWIQVTGNQAIIAWLQDVLLTQKGESPFYSDWGISYQETFVNRVYPDFDVAMIEDKFRDYVSLIKITRLESDDDNNNRSKNITYHIRIHFNDGQIYDSNSQNVLFNQSFSQTGPY